VNTESGIKNKWLANTSLILGILSFGLALASFLPIFWASNGGTFGMIIALGMLALLTMLGGLILGIPGFIMGVIALVRFRKRIDHNNILRTATVGIILSSLGIATPLIFFVVPELLTPR
jgi:D-alanyl-lipoteichoic acid acyltransferase DltB (MBOAT superfamily)